MGMVKTSRRQQPHWDKKCQLNATDWSSMNKEKTLTLQGTLQLVPKQYMYMYMYIDTMK